MTVKDTSKGAAVVAGIVTGAGVLALGYGALRLAYVVGGWLWG